jgi:uncharacterized protein YegP (UPF0339 family)
MPWKVFKSNRDKKWYFHVTGDNGEIIVPSQPYSRRDSATRAVKTLQAQMLKDAAKSLEPNSGGSA